WFAAPASGRSPPAATVWDTINGCAAGRGQSSAHSPPSWRAACAKASWPGKRLTPSTRPPPTPSRPRAPRRSPPARPAPIPPPPPQGASWPGPYAAEALSRAVADKLALPWRRLLERTDRKRYHSPFTSRRQARYNVNMPETVPALVLVIDDCLTSGYTLRLSL